MGRFSWFQPFIPSYSEGLDFIGKSMDAERQRVAKRDELAQKARFENEQNAVLRSRSEEQARRDKVKEAQEQSDRQVKLTANLSALLGKGRGTEAQALARSSQFEDQSGAMHGVELTPEYNVTAREGADTAGNQALARFLHQGPGGTQPPTAGPDGAPAQPTDAENETAGALDFIEEQTNQKLRQEQQTNPSAYRVSFPGGQSSVIDPRESRLALRQQAEEDAQGFERAASQETDPVKRQQWLTMAQQRRAQMTNAERADFTGNVGREDSQEFNREENEKYKMTAGQQHEIGLERARNAGQGKLIVSPGEAARNARGDLGALRADINDWQKDSGYGDMFQTFRDLQKARDEIRSGNPIQETGVRFSIGRKIAGPGVFTEGEQKAILGRVGGEFSRWDQLVQTFVDGRLTPEQQGIFMGAIDSKLGRILKTEAVQKAENFRRTYTTPGSGYEDMQPNVVNRYNSMFSPFGISWTGDQPQGEGVRLGIGAAQRKTGAAPRQAPRAPATGPAPAAQGQLVRLKDGRVVRQMPDGSYEEP